MASSATRHLLLLSFLPFLPIFGASNITLGSSLSTIGDNSSWISPSGDFAFGFYQLNNTNIFLLAIWYANIPEKTVVWHAKTTSPVPSGSKVELTANGLTLNNPDGQTIWQAQLTTTISYASMLDSGNFVLSTSTNSSAYLWESFSYPTDTLLPTQVLPLDGKMFSKLTETNYSQGRFVLHLENGDLRLKRVDWPTDFLYPWYYQSATDSADSSQSGFQLVFNQSADIYIVKRNGEIVHFWKSIDLNSPNNYYRATLGFDGVFRLYVYSKTLVTDQSWSILQYQPENVCNILDGISSGACGFNSICRENHGTPSCQCPPGFSFMDPNDKFGGCKPNFPLGCGVDDGSRKPEDLYYLELIPELNFPSSGAYEVFQPENQTLCEQSCLHDCSCTVAVFDGSNGRCWKTKMPLSYGRMSGGTTIIKIRRDVPPSGNSDAPFSNSKKDNHIFSWPLIFGSSSFFNILLLVAVSFFVFSRYQKNPKKTLDDSNALKTNLHIFTFEELKEATQGFKEELGVGSFGIVYKGVLNFGSKNQVAVKKLDKLSPEGEKEFKAEVNAIGRTHHRNLIQLIGYCAEGPQRLLVYELMSNGSLANFLFSLPRLDWCSRTQIALGIARGLVYLHEECSAPIIHCDIKPQNILIDEYFIARISDFGLAKSLMFNQTRTHTGIRGTRGYVAPEWFKNSPVTVKVDVYSFGVMLLEIICCRKSVAMECGEEERAILTDWAYDCYMGGRLDTLVDNDEEAMSDIMMLRRWVATALCCIQENPLKRPTMKIVIQMLEGFGEVPIPTGPYSFCLAS
ncbi:G-type lectin S-receptor-like serine/threonine-protein kinase LECRK3 [Camellia lanceoleosa]|uniref:G-type lectin S-receptor-like serine/threonine-protein kinase LECRK3 n=1 Tax=Camellia lanceoleosa TaxID=1840588 RepID=A0ACC0FKT0_9ERIC|nr:G-type lectin S-receptor-like serine/threonine-protein kinase LECRK3 [Camellia lanceoleosa]